jgi:hypothetical protein
MGAGGLSRRLSSEAKRSTKVEMVASKVEAFEDRDLRRDIGFIGHILIL